jgi:hypothetical protein
MLKQASRFTPFSPDGFPARKAYGAGLTHDKHIVPLARTFVRALLQEQSYLHGL